MGIPSHALLPSKIHHVNLLASYKPFISFIESCAAEDQDLTLECSVHTWNLQEQWVGDMDPGASISLADLLSHERELFVDVDPGYLDLPRTASEYKAPDPSRDSDERTSREQA